MRSHHEAQVFSAVIKNARMEGDILYEMSNNYPITTTSLMPDLSWENLRIPEITVSGMRVIGFRDLRKETYDNWISINNQPCFLIPFIANHQVTLVSKEEFEKLETGSNYSWSMLYTLTRPGFSQDFSQALIQINGSCPAMPCAYSSLLYLENPGEQWQVKSSYGIYNQ